MFGFLVSMVCVFVDYVNLCWSLGRWLGAVKMGVVI